MEELALKGNMAELITEYDSYFTNIDFTHIDRAFGEGSRL
jgi:hypothetical protein